MTRLRFAAALAVFALAWGGPVLAVPPQPVADALAMISAGGGRLSSGWRYTQTITGTQHTEKLAYDASRPAGRRWKVVSVNGKTPGPQQARELEKQAGQLNGKGKGRGASLASGVDNWLEQSRYQLVDSTGGQLVYQIHPQAGGNADATTRAMLKHLAGRFVIDGADHRPIELSLQNFEAFSPRFGVKINGFQLRIHFRRLHGDGNPVVADEVSTEAKGKVFWVKGFKATTKVVLSDFAPVGGTRQAPASATSGKD